MRHELTVHNIGDTRYTCEQCPYKSPDRWKFKKHVDVVHSHCTDTDTPTLTVCWPTVPTVCWRRYRQSAGRQQSGDRRTLMLLADASTRRYRAPERTDSNQMKRIDCWARMALFTRITAHTSDWLTIWSLVNIHPSSYFKNRSWVQECVLGICR